MASSREVCLPESLGMLDRISNRLHQAFRVNRLSCLPAVESRFPFTGWCDLTLVGPRLVGLLIHDFFLLRHEHESFRGNSSASNPGGNRGHTGGPLTVLHKLIGITRNR